MASNLNGGFGGQWMNAYGQQLGQGLPLKVNADGSKRHAEALEKANAYNSVALSGQQQAQGAMTEQLGAFANATSGFLADRKNTQMSIDAANKEAERQEEERSKSQKGSFLTSVIGTGVSLLGKVFGLPI
jgi:hypothetical protein